MRKILFPLFLLFSVNLVASDHIHYSEQRLVKYYYESAQELNEFTQFQLRESAAWKNFLLNNGDWYVIFNEYNKKPHRAFGKPIQLLQGNNYYQLAIDFINQNLQDFNIPIDELKLQGITSSDNYHTINFGQVINGVDVIDSRLVIKLTNDNKVVLFGLDIFNDVLLSTTPQHTEQSIVPYAFLDIIDEVTDITYNGLKILPIPFNSSYVFKLVHSVNVHTIGSDNIPANWITYIDDETGDILYRTNQVKHIDVDVEGEVVTTTPFAPASIVSLPNLNVSVGGNNYTTDVNGVATIPSSGNANFQLAGLWSTIETNNTTPLITTSVNQGSVVSFDDNNSTLQERTAYYHVNIIHDYLKQHYPSFTGMDFSIPTNIDLTSGDCNAFYSGSTINFYATGGGCNSMALVPDIIYHEYAHAISYAFYSAQGVNFSNGALGEANSDIWAFAITENPILGTGYTNDVSDYVRRYDIDPKIYPQDIVGEVHADGEILAGSLWDLGINLGSVSQMMDLYAQALYGTPNGPDGNEGSVFTDVLIEILYADDVSLNGGDNDITNGTPNDIAIINAFASHGITLISNATIVHSNQEEALPTVDIDVNATIYLTYAWALEDSKLFYKLNNSNNWNETILNNITGNSYTALIPAQPPGTLISYYLALEDINGILSGVTPFASNQNDPNLPYFILVGTALMHTDDFDTFQGQWTLGEGDDNATTGIWVIDVPVGSFSDLNGDNQPDFNDPTAMVQTNVDATQGVNNIACALTGNAGANDGIGTNDVDDGKTTLISPPFDLTGYSNPIVTYKRYYTNNPPSGANPGADWWQVLISNDGVSWVYLENTKTSDKKWRKNAFRLNDYLPSSNKVYLKFIASDSTRLGEYLDGGSLIEAAVDDILIYDESDISLEEKPLTYFNIYPNPTTNFLILDFDINSSSTEVVYKLFDAKGKCVLSNEVSDFFVGNNKIQIKLDGISAGNYIINLKVNDIIMSKKVFISR